MNRTITVIIPTLNEELFLEAALREVSGIPNVEIIVVDGGSSDGTVTIAEHFDCRIIISEPSRSRQMNIGAQSAKGDILLFLHADSVLSSGWTEELRNSFSRNDCVAAGGFSLALDHPGWPFHLIAAMSNLRARLLGWIYGDQAIFIRRSVFEGLGGYRDLPIMEDFDLMERVRRKGKVVLLDAKVHSSSRWWLAHGFILTSIMYWLVLVGYRVGVPPEKLSRFVKKVRARAKNQEATVLGAGNGVYP